MSDQNRFLRFFFFRGWPNCFSVFFRGTIFGKTGYRSLLLSLGGMIFFFPIFFGKIVFYAVGFNFFKILFLQFQIFHHFNFGPLKNQEQFSSFWIDVKTEHF